VTNEFQDNLAQPIFIGEHKEDPQNSLCHSKDLGINSPYFFDYVHQ